MTKLEFMETWFRRVWAEEDMDAITELLVPDGKVHGLQKVPSVGPDEFRGFAELVLKLIRDVDITVERLIEDGDWASILMHIEATSHATGKKIAFSGQAMVRIVDNRIVEGYNLIDFISMFEQLGQMPADTLPSCLCGKAVA